MSLSETPKDIQLVLPQLLKDERLCPKRRAVCFTLCSVFLEDTWFEVIFIYSVDPKELTLAGVRKL